MDPQGGLIVVDKPGGMTSHDVVATVRRVLRQADPTAGRRGPKVGHAGTLDPMATGLLVLGVGPATRLLGYLTGANKTYTATIRLGEATDSDDADGTVVASQPATQLTPAVISAALARWTGVISQVPSSVSAIKVDGRRAYAQVRAGHSVDLPAREVEITRLDFHAVRHNESTVDVDIVVSCSSGTYIRALARDVGNDLGVGGHLTALRRIELGPFTIDDAVPLPELTTTPMLTMPLARAVQLLFPRRDATEEDTGRLRQGQSISAAETPPATSDRAAEYGVFDVTGAPVAVVREEPDRSGQLVAKPVIVFP